MSISVTFVGADGKETSATGDAGMSVLQLAQEVGLDIEGACEGNMACSTCHVIVDKEFFPKLPEASDEEEDMLDLASGLKGTSRLGCQLELAPELDGMRLQLPAESRNMLGL
jgi:ferredoxin